MHENIDSHSCTPPYCLQKIDNQSNLGHQISPRFCWLEDFDLKMLPFAFAVVIWDCEAPVQKVLLHLMVTLANERTRTALWKASY